MTLFGKLLVFVQFLLSLVFLGWAIGLYTQRVEWAPPKTLAGDPETEDEVGKDGQVDAKPKKGKLDELNEQVKAAVESRNTAETRWQAAAATLTKVEENREAYQKWYADELSLLKTGQDMAGKAAEKPVLDLVRLPDGQFNMDPKARKPVTLTSKDGKELPVKFVDYYLAQSDKLKKEINEAQDKLDDLVKQATELSYVINGKPNETRGLRRHLDEFLSYQKTCDDEMKFLKPQVENGQTVYEGVMRRNAQLKRRLLELEAAAANR